MGRSILPVALLVAWWATASANPRVYVPNGGNVSVMDTSTDSVIATIPLSTGASGGVAAAASRVYVGHAYQGSVAVLDVGRNTVSSIIRFPDLFQGIQAIALSPDGRRAFASVGNQLSIIDTTSNTVSAGPYVGRPLGLAVHPDGTRLYVASVDTSKLAVIDIATNTVTANVDVDPYAHAVLVHPDGTRVYVTSTTGTVSVVDTATNVASMKFAVGSEPFGIAVHPDGTRLYVTDVQQNSLWVLDATTGAVIAVVPMGSSPTGVGVHPDGSRVYVTNGNSHNVSVVDASTNVVTTTVAVRDFPQALGIFIGGCPGPDGDCDGDGVPDGNDGCPGQPNPDQHDGDVDGVDDVCDNCPVDANSDQADRDRNGVGDACQDVDGDGLIDIADNCPNVANADQTDSDGDGHGDACDLCPGHDDRIDADHDGVPDSCDNCPAAYNADQADADGNGRGDACDDRDGDGIIDSSDNCPDVSNAAQDDRDGDRIGDVCDPCTDFDGDGFGDPGFPGTTCAGIDNCPTIPNVSQNDSDGDGIGDDCKVCGPLGDAIHYGVVAERKLRVQNGITYGFSVPVDVMGSACTTKALLIGGGVDNDLVALAATGRAVTLRDARDQNSVAYVGGALITAGGGVSQPKNDIAAYRVDTSGSSTQVPACRRAMTDMVAASDRFASLPPTRTFGDVLVREGEEVDIPVSRGDVIELASLVTTGKSGPAFLSRTCADYAYVVFSGDLDDVVINVRGKLSLGPCAVIGSYQYSSILNVVGDGSAVRIAAQADTSGMPLLAPRRKVVVTGTNNDYEIPTSVGPIWAKTVTMSGYTFQYGNGDYSTFCTP